MVSMTGLSTFMQGGTGRLSLSFECNWVGSDMVVMAGNALTWNAPVDASAHMAWSLWGSYHIMPTLNTVPVCLLRKTLG